MSHRGSPARITVHVDRRPHCAFKVTRLSHRERWEVVRQKCYLCTGWGDFWYGIERVSQDEERPCTCECHELVRDVVRRLSGEPPHETKGYVVPVAEDAYTTEGVAFGGKSESAFAGFGGTCDVQNS